MLMRNKSIPILCSFEIDENIKKKNLMFDYNIIDEATADWFKEGFILISSASEVKGRYCINVNVQEMSECSL